MCGWGKGREGWREKKEEELVKALIILRESYTNYSQGQKCFQFFFPVYVPCDYFELTNLLCYSKHTESPQTEIITQAASTLLGWHMQVSLVLGMLAVATIERHVAIDGPTTHLLCPLLECDYDWLSTRFHCMCLIFLAYV